ncbi:hypothetical protein HY994_05510 [Candidatus Micrarchaeota archaeon]|nr:hypothetical protein [Candidatus Micrarchaeota archaeon]
MKPLLRARELLHGFEDRDSGLNHPANTPVQIGQIESNRTGKAKAVATIHYDDYDPKRIPFEIELTPQGYYAGRIGDKKGTPRVFSLHYNVKDQKPNRARFGGGWAYLWVQADEQVPNELKRKFRSDGSYWGPHPNANEVHGLTGNVVGVKSKYPTTVSSRIENDAEREDQLREALREAILLYHKVQGQIQPHAQARRKGHLTPP